MTATQRLGTGRHQPAAEIPAHTTTSAHELTTHDGATTYGLLRKVPGATAAVFLMHPRQDFSHHVLVSEFLRHGFAVWTQGSRTMGNDLTLLHEQAVLDMAAGHVFLRQLGFRHVVAVGHSGGAALAALYLQQAALVPADRLTAAPGGKLVPLPDAELPVADGLLLMAPHRGPGALLRRSIDPSVTDEADPTSVNPDLNPYSPANGFAAPPASSSYASDFVARYRTAQRSRIALIDAIAWQRIDESARSKKKFQDTEDAQDRRAALASGVLVVHRTDADLRSVDLSLDANDRPYGSLFGIRPDLTNYGIIGFGRLTTPEAWLSTWSENFTRADLAACARSVHVPTLIVELTGDQACFPKDAALLAKSFAHPDVTHIRIPGRHFGGPLLEGMTSGAALAGIEMTKWLKQRYT